MAVDIAPCERHPHIGEGGPLRMLGTGGVEHLENRAILAQVDIVTDPLGSLVIPERCFHWLHFSCWSVKRPYMPMQTLVLLLSVGHSRGPAPNYQQRGQIQNGLLFHFCFPYCRTGHRPSRLRLESSSCPCWKTAPMISCPWAFMRVLSTPSPNGI